MKAVLLRHLTAFRHSRAFLGLSLALAWFCFYCVLVSTDGSGDSLMNKVISRHNFNFAFARSSTNSNPDVDPLEKDCTLNMPELRMSSLQLLLQPFNLRLIYPASQRALKLEATKNTGKCMAEILIDLLQPHGYGFFRQGNSISVNESTLKQERVQPQKGDSSPFQSSLVRMTFRAKVGEPLDLWVARDPLMRLRIEIQPLYGEAQNKETANLIGFNIQGYRDQEVWFFQKMKSRLGEEAQIDVKAGGHMWCLLTPVSLQGNEITLKMEFYYETILPTV